MFFCTRLCVNELCSMCSWAINGMIKSSVEHHKKFDYVESIFYELKK